MDSEKTRLQELERQFTELGGSLNHYRLKEKFSEADLLAEQEYQFEAQQLAEAESKRPAWAKTAGELAGKGLSLVSLVFTFIFILLGLMAGTVALIVAEYVAVFEGFKALSSVHAELYSFSLVLFYIVVLFVEQIVIDRYGQRQPKKFSFRLLALDFAYFMGFGESWETQYQEAPDEAKRIKSTVTLLTYAIILFGLLGRLSQTMTIYQNLTWAEAIVKILFDSNLQTFIGYIAMLIATAALLFSNKWVVHFIYAQFRRVTGGVIVQDFSAASIVILSPVQRIEAARAKVLEREIMRLESGKKQEG